MAHPGTVPASLASCGTGGLLSYLGGPAQEYYCRALLEDGGSEARGPAEWMHLRR